MSDEEEERQKELSLRWDTKHHWPDLREEFRVTKTGAAMILSLVTANDWLRYSRRWQHYSVPRRYRNPLYTYRRVVEAAEYLAAHELIHHAKAEPGQRGWQSAVRATTELVERTNCIISAGPPLIIAKPAEVIILRGKDRMPVDYVETKFTRRAREEMELINEFLSQAEVVGCFVAPLRRIFNNNFSRGGRLYAAEGAPGSLAQNVVTYGGTGRNREDTG